MDRRDRSRSRSAPPPREQAPSTRNHRNWYTEEVWPVGLTLRILASHWAASGDRNQLCIIVERVIEGEGRGDGDGDGASESAERPLGSVWLMLAMRPLNHVRGPVPPDTIVDPVVIQVPDSDSDWDSEDSEAPFTRQWRAQL